MNSLGGPLTERGEIRLLVGQGVDGSYIAKPPGGLALAVKSTCHANGFLSGLGCQSTCHANDFFVSNIS